MRAVDFLETEQQHYTSIANMIEGYSETDRAFMLWYLLQDYQVFVGCEGLKEGLEGNVNDDTPIYTYALNELISIHATFIREMREMLYYAVF